MFSGLNNFIKYILPKRLFYRALIIVAAPTIILQIIITIVFYDSIWIKANKNITRSLVNQLKTIEEVYKNDKKNLDLLALLILFVTRPKRLLFYRFFFLKIWRISFSSKNSGRDNGGEW